MSNDRILANVERRPAFRKKKYGNTEARKISKIVLYDEALEAPKYEDLARDLAIFFLPTHRDYPQTIDVIDLSYYARDMRVFWKNLESKKVVRSMIGETRRDRRAVVVHSRNNQRVNYEAPVFAESNDPKWYQRILSLFHYPHYFNNVINKTERHLFRRVSLENSNSRGEDRIIICCCSSRDGRTPTPSNEYVDTTDTRPGRFATGTFFTFFFFFLQSTVDIMS